jgi:hypothetical protein
MWRQPGRVASHAIRQVALIHDVVSLIHRVGVMPDKLFCPERGTPVRSKLRTAVRWKSCGMRPGSPAARGQALIDLSFWPRRPRDRHSAIAAIH